MFIFIRDVNRPGPWFPERGFILEHQIFRFAKMILTSAVFRMTWHHFFVASATLQRHGLEKMQNALVRGRQLCTQRSIIEGSLAELLRFWCCQLQTLRKSGKIVSFLTLPSSKLRKPGKIFAFLMLSKSKTEGVSQNGFVSLQIDR